MQRRRTVVIVDDIGRLIVLMRRRASSSAASADATCAGSRRFVAAQPSAGHAAFHQALQPHCDLRQQFVADRVTERVVDCLETSRSIISIAQRVWHRWHAPARAQILVQAEPVRQAGQIVEPRMRAICSAVARCSVTSEPTPKTRTCPLRRARRADSSTSAVRRDRDRHNQVGKAFAPLHPLGHFVQAFQNIRRFPRIAGQSLQRRHALERRRWRRGQSQARRDMDQAAVAVGLPQPVSRGFLELAPATG